ncbi:hypothetical protein ACHQM5_001067 [Ranunculus cassubicifolius]
MMCHSLLGGLESEEQQRFVRTKAATDLILTQVFLMDSVIFNSNKLLSSVHINWARMYFFKIKSCYNMV